MTPYEVFAGALAGLGGVSVAYAAYAKHRFDKRFVAKPSTDTPDVQEPSRTDQATMTALIDQAVAVTKTAAALQKAIIEKRTSRTASTHP
jgi:hypothetical protein